MDIATLWIGWFIVWTAGVAVVAALRSGEAPWTDGGGAIASTIGYGWFLGQFMLTLWMRALSAAGVPFGVLAIGAPLACIALVATWVAARRAGGVGDVARRLRALGRVIVGGDLEGRRRAVWLFLIGWMALRLALLLFDVTLRPLYPWDAWTQWATKARVWYALKTIVPFVGAPTWFDLPLGAAYFDAAPDYPATIPLTQVWSAVLLGRFDDALINLPWWLTVLAFAFAVYGFLRYLALSPLSALTGTWIAISLPILDVHVALAGYADLAMATYLTLAALAWLRFARQRLPADVVLAVALSLACVLIKNPGKVWVLMLVPGVVAALLPRYRLVFAAAFIAVAAIVAVVATQSGTTVLGYQTRLAFRMPWRSLGDAYFIFANWHLLFYGAIAVALLAWRRLLEPALAPLTITIAAGLGFLVFGFGFTNAGAWVEDQATVNRATLHLAPLIAVWMIVAFRTWMQAREVPPSALMSPSTAAIATAQR